MNGLDDEPVQNGVALEGDDDQGEGEGGMEEPMEPLVNGQDDQDIEPIIGNIAQRIERFVRFSRDFYT